MDRAAWHLRPRGNGKRDLRKFDLHARRIASASFLICRQPDVIERATTTSLSARETVSGAALAPDALQEGARSPVRSGFYPTASPVLAGKKHHLKEHRVATDQPCFGRRRSRGRNDVQADARHAA